MNAHDLLWGMAPEHLSTEAPGWVADVLRAGLPVVVRRDRMRAGWVAVGVRGAGRDQRWAAWMPVAAVTRRVEPGQLWGVAPVRDLPVFRTLEAVVGWLGAAVQPIRDHGSLPQGRVQEILMWERPMVANGPQSGPKGWGIGGSAGYELATGIPVASSSSDLDLILQCPNPISRSAAQTLLKNLDNLGPSRIDCQLQLPQGGLALAEWAGTAAKVMLKTDNGPVLVTDPWQAQAA